MSDGRLRSFERRYHQSGDPQDAVRYAAALVGSQMKHEARTLLHPLTKRFLEARYLFVSLLPNETSCAFCNQCGKAFTLNEDGFPLDAKGTKRERKSRCEDCSLSSAGRTYRGRSVKPKYCGRCGIVLRDPAHRCDRKLPDWISGGKTEPRREPSSHWSNWRQFS